MRGPHDPRRLLPVVLLILASPLPGAAQAPLPSPARDAAEAFIEIVRSGDEARLRGFIEARFTRELQDLVPMEEHLRMVAMFRSDLEGREITEVELRGPYEVALVLEGPDDRLELRMEVETDPPHRITGLSVGDAGPEIRAASLYDLHPELERLAEDEEFSGVVLVTDSGQITFNRAYGLADRDAGRHNTPETRFDVGSLYKLFTSVAVLRLSQDGRLDLSDRLGQHLEGFRPSVAEKVTIRHLLQHRSGLGDYLSHPEFVADPQRFVEPADYLPLARRQELAFEPGTDTRYSNMGFVVLGAIVERVTGRGYHDVIDELVFEPAGMTTAGPAGGEQAARRYHRTDTGLVAVDSLYPDVASPAGGGFASATDLRRFVEALLDNRLLAGEHTALLLRGFETTGKGGPSVPEEVGYAGGAPGVNAAVLIRPAQHHTVVVLSNRDPDIAVAMAGDVQRLADAAGPDSGA